MIPMKLKKPGWWLLLVLLTACVEEKQAENKFFDFDKLIDDQAALLTEQKPMLVKAASLGSPARDTVFQPTLQGWKRELEAFRLLETINKPAFQKSYRVDDAIEDPASNLKIHEFTSEKARVTSVRLYYHNDLSRLKKIECDMVQRNLLYSNKDELTMTFDDDNGRNVLTGYSMKGYQKMIFGDTTRFAIQGTIAW
ncbi:MAG TPA: hypothetical protein VG737_14395 [Cyclobacteriaceae bacterium]|nr:hypothetical protein [Cyclobacteriaceae bacterium]